MITVTFYRDSTNYTGFLIKGHAGYAAAGKDIVCAAVSVLSTNTVNSIETFTSDEFDVKEDDGYLEFHFKNESSSESQLLFNSLVLGLQEISKDQKKYLRIIFKEV